MKRIQLFEFEDYEWFPKPIRTAMTNLIMVLLRMMKVPENLAHFLAPILKENHIDQIVDLGSGSGGAMPEILQILQKTEGFDALEVTLTDKFPNKEIVEEYNNFSINNLSYSNISVDASEMEKIPRGLKTMFNSFHHMPKEKAKAILKSAADNQQPFLIYELSDNKMPTIVWWLLLPISLFILHVMVFFMTPFVKRLTWQQLVFTYLIPIIPWTYAWDGQASLPRIYTANDIELLTKDFRSSAYSWTTGMVKDKNGKDKGMYVLGLPTI